MCVCALSTHMCSPLIVSSSTLSSLVCRLVQFCSHLAVHLALPFDCLISINHIKSPFLNLSPLLFFPCVHAENSTAVRWRAREKVYLKMKIIK